MKHEEIFYCFLTGILQVKEISLGERIERLAMDGNDNIVILHDNQIRSFKDAKNIYDVELISPARAITATDDQVKLALFLCQIF